MTELPAEPGSYALRLALERPVHLAIGRLGSFEFPAGAYLYLGSARGPGGLRARLRHHARLHERPHWHLDWLRPYARLTDGWYAQSCADLECAWSQAIAALPGVKIPASGFGSADCRQGCPAHLLLLPREMPQSAIEQALKHPLGGFPLKAFKIE